ncbi:hypothetical protein SYNPS1DRAFT_22812 [Syncephalis pseudoplumigaleata]|uniref:Uncharacterized protein n=1 Tax=Syncephalis pseudoplumigaleata TaxID=1712513 RepID=A0A4P9Z0G9_9FUNG|nr:hypothetical protein SYNPS1DRAFT_22812 [Syncephalis pseudoplumigaleata]|eukprot:RKP25191.1 hypothetical protein SYNPS1DRAFT_22812 [Syncephalis pseudoplumigaleata]
MVYALDGREHIAIIHNSFVKNPAPYRIDGMLVFADFLVGSNSSCQLTVNTAAKAWARTYAMRRRYSAMIILHAREGYPPPKGFLSVSQAGTPRPLRDLASPDLLPSGILLHDYSGDIARLMEQPGPVEAVMSLSIFRMNKLFTTAHMTWYAVVFYASMALFVYSIVLFAYLLCRQKLRFELKTIPFLTGLTSALCKSLEYLFIDYPFSSTIAMRTGNFAYVFSFLTILLIWSTIIASIQDQYRQKWENWIIYGCYIACFVLHVTNIIAWCSQNNYFSYWITRFYLIFINIVYFLLAIVFAYYAITFYRNKRKYQIKKATAQALNRASGGGDGVSIFRAASCIFSNMELHDMNQDVIMFFATFTDAGCLLGITAIFWFLGPLSTYDDYSGRGILIRCMDRLCRRRSQTSGPATVDNNTGHTDELSDKTKSYNIRSSNILVSGLAQDGSRAAY